MGRFMSPDWATKPEGVPYSSLSDPQTLNLYGYMRNNPLGGTDPDGHCGQQQAGSGTDCTKLPNNPIAQVSPATKAQINDAVKATGKPAPGDPKGGSHEEAGISYTVDGKQTQAPAVPGPGKDVTTPGPATSDPYKAVDPSKAKPGDVQADVAYHTHPSATATTFSTNAEGQTVKNRSQLRPTSLRRGYPERESFSDDQSGHRNRRQNGLRLHECGMHLPREPKGVQKKTNDVIAKVALDCRLPSLHQRG
jgi:hypothetical protein